MTSKNIYLKNTLNSLSFGLHQVDIDKIGELTLNQVSENTSREELLKISAKIAADLTCENSPDLALFSGRLMSMSLREGVFNGELPTLGAHIAKNVSEGWYSQELLDGYSTEDIAFLDTKINHNRDFSIPMAGMGQLIGKYLIQDRVTKSIKESPQLAFMAMAMIFATMKEKGGKPEESDRNALAVEIYDAISLFKISLPTPIMSGVRTKTKQFSSCTLIEAGDSLDEINSASSAVIKYISQRAGIGLNVGMIRGLGSPIRNGEAYHTGLIPFIKHFQTAVKSCSQGGVRGGAGTLFFPIWHLEFENLVVLKNNRGVEENRARHLDYAVQLNKSMYTRIMKGQNICLFSPSDVPGLYDAFFEDQEEFEELYSKYENDKNIRKKVVNGLELFTALAQERNSTGRIYIQNVDHSNIFGPFIEKKAPIKQSNLCMEITLPTKPLKSHVFDEGGEVALCTLAGFNLGKIEKLSELEHLSNILVRMLDFILDYQDYPIPASRISSKKRRTLGIGVINWAYYLAKHKVRPSDRSAHKLTHETFEAIQYYLLKASNNLAKEKGACPGFNETKYSNGILPIDNYKKDIDDLGNFELKQDWQKLREEIKEFGLRNSTLTALMPAETSSQISGSTNGIEPSLQAISVKSSKDGNLVSVVPELSKLRPYYEFRWEIKDNKPVIEMMGIMQKFVDQAISANTNYDPKNYPRGLTPIKLIMQDIFYAYKMGLKTLYYSNTRDGADDAHEYDGCAGGACKL